MPEPEEVRRFMWALGVAEREYAWGGDYPYTDAQRARNRLKMLDRARWLALHGPYMPPVSKEVRASREGFLRGDL
jgi:hypothetical protein